MNFIQWKNKASELQKEIWTERTYKYKHKQKVSSCNQNQFKGKRKRTLTSQNRRSRMKEFWQKYKHALKRNQTPGNMSCVTRLALTVDTAGVDGAADTNREALETAPLRSVHCQVNADLKINRGPLCSSHTGRRDKVKQHVQLFWHQRRASQTPICMSRHRASVCLQDTGILLGKSRFQDLPGPTRSPS